MTLIIGYNVTDASYGWDGTSKGFVLYYSHFTEEHVIQDKQIPLSSGLMPDVIFKTVKRVYIGEPYTPCVNISYTTNHYDKWNTNDGRYSQRFGMVFLQKISQAFPNVNVPAFLRITPNGIRLVPLKIP